MPPLLLLLLLLSLAGGAVAINSNWRTAANASRYLPLLNATEKKYGIPPDLLARLAYQESHWRDDIVTGKTVSSAGALGIMQLVPRYHPTVNPLDVAKAIDYAGGYLRQLYNQFGAWPLALAAYNAGPTVVADFRAGTNVSGKNPSKQRTGGVPPFAETVAYVSQISRDVGLA